MLDDKETRSQNLSKFLREFIKIFETVLLPQPTTRNTQFFLFHLLSMKSTFSDSFVDWLLKRLLMPTGSVSRRLAAASYLCGFLARADYAPNSTIQTTCQILRWLKLASIDFKMKNSWVSVDWIFLLLQLFFLLVNLRLSIFKISPNRNNVTTRIALPRFILSHRPYSTWLFFANLKSALRTSENWVCRKFYFQNWTPWIRAYQE